MKKTLDIQSIYIKNMEEMIKKFMINTKFVEEEIVINVKKKENITITKFKKRVKGTKYQ